MVPVNGGKGTVRQLGVSRIDFDRLRGSEGPTSFLNALAPAGVNTSVRSCVPRVVVSGAAGRRGQ
jgi:hypothetical protein